MIEFKDNEKRYFEWLAAHPDGYVLNVRSKADPNYVVLHRASCGSISSSKPAPGAYTCRGFRKWCAETILNLRVAAKKEGRQDGTFSKRCGHCRP